MSQKNQLTVYPDDETDRRLKDFQAEQKLSKSKAADALIRKGLDAHYGGLIDDIYLELAKISGIVGLILLMLVAVSDGGTLPFNPVYVAFVFIAASFVFMLADRFGPSLRSIVRSETAADADATTTNPR